MVNLKVNLAGIEIDNPVKAVAELHCMTPRWGAMRMNSLQ